MNAKGKEKKPAYIRTVTVKAGITQEFVDYVIDTAETSIGYWANGCGTQPEKVFINGRPKNVARCKCEENEQSSKGPKKQFVLDTELICKGIQIVLSADFPINEDIRATLFRALSENDAGHVDCEVADALVQAAVFNELVYG